MSKAQTNTKPLTPQMLSIVVSPVITEKSTLGLEHGQYTFKVTAEATKPQIKAAIESIYKVKVKAVNTSVLKGKTKRFRGIESVRSDIKKAIVTLEEGQQIDLTTGV